MKVNELMIGNLIYYTKDWYKDPNYKMVVKVDTNLLKEIDRTNKTFPVAKSILLTEDWLLSLGYIRWKNKKIWTFKGVMIYQMADGCFYYGKKSTRVKIETVHHCQNLTHALTGWGLEPKEKQDA